MASRRHESPGRENLHTKQFRSGSWTRLDSGISDESCTKDMSPRASSLLSPLLSPTWGNNVSGLITPFKAVSPASSTFTSPGGSYEYLALSRSASCGNLLYINEENTRQNSPDSAVVEDLLQTHTLLPTDSKASSSSPTRSVSPSQGYNCLSCSCHCRCHKHLRDFKELAPRHSEGTRRKVLRTPSVIISDHTGDTVSLHVALAGDDFTYDQLQIDKRPVSAPLSDVDLVDANVCLRKVSECSTCSSVSTVDMNPSSCMLGEFFDRRISDCSTCSSCLTVSDDDGESLVAQPAALPNKSSNWRKVRNVVQWTPFIQTYKRHKYPWVQLAGHQGNFKAGFRQGTILKKLCPAEEKAFEEISKDVLQPFVPEYLGVVEGPENERYLQLQDLLSDFGSPCVMDLKMGVRTYLEDELAKAREKPKLRKDMYEKMIQIDPDAPSPAENEAKAVTKPRYMVWRETISSTATLGFRIEGVRRGDGTSSKEFKTTRTKEQVLAALSNFLNGYPNAHAQYIQRLKAIRATLEVSPFFKTHELIGSSLLFVHNKSDASIWLIDFAKTVPLPEDVRISHREPWIEGSHEDGYLLGLNNLIELMIYLQQVLSHTQHGNFILKNTESAIGHVNNSSNVTTNQNITRQKPDTTLISSSEKSASSSNQSSKILETVTAIPAVSSSASSNSVLLRGTKPVSVSQGGVAL